MIRETRSSVWSWAKRPRVDEEVDAELAFHVEMVMQSLIAAGWSARDARAEAVQRFGDMAVVAAECRRYGRQRDRSRSRAEYFRELKQDCTFALRQLGRARAFTATAMVTLALGIGATAAVFSALYAVVLKPLPFADADRVVQIMPSRRGTIGEFASSAEFAAIRERRDAFGDAAAVMGGGFTLSGSGAVPEIIEGSLVSAEFFRVVGVRPALGRGFLPSDDVPGTPHVVIMSHRLWLRRFAGDTSVIGRTLRLNEEPHTVVGVLPEAFNAAAGDRDMWAPRQLTAEQLANNSGQWLRVIARLAPGVTLAQASEAARVAITTLAARTSRSLSVGAVVQRYSDVAVGGLRQRLLVLFGAVGFVLLIACVNVANLLLARGTVRARELAIRTALGAGRGRLVRQLLAETLVLGLGGAVAGVAVAYALVKALVAVGPVNVPRLDQARVDGIVLAFTFGVAIVTSVVVGLVPALRNASPAAHQALREGGRGGGSGVQRERLRALLVAAEVALAMTLLTGSGLLIRTAWRLQHVNPGFTPSHVMTARVLLPATRYADAANTTHTYEQIRDAAAQVPGVERAALVSVVPLSGDILSSRVAPEGRTLSADELISVDIRYASSDYFAAMGMSLEDGRDFARTDDQRALPVAIISRSLAQKLWPNERAIGKRIDAMRTQRDSPNLLTVVGIVADVRHAALSLPATPTLYMPFTQTAAGMWAATGRSMVLVARTTPEPAMVIKGLQRAVMTVDGSLPLTDVRPMDQWLSASTARARFNTLLLSTLGGLALILASVGVYGVVAYFVSQRTREIGVRMALGATPGDIWRLVLVRGLRPIVWGAIGGAVLSLLTARLLREQLYGVSAEDPMTLVAVLATLIGVAALATLLPARRAMRVTPVVALAAE